MIHSSMGSSGIGVWTNRLNEWFKWLVTCQTYSSSFECLESCNYRAGFRWLQWQVYREHENETYRHQIYHVSRYHFLVCTVSVTVRGKTLFKPNLTKNTGLVMFCTCFKQIHRYRENLSRVKQFVSGVLTLSPHQLLKLCRQERKIGWEKIVQTHKPQRRETIN